MKTAFTIAAALLAGAASLHADTPIQLSLTPDIALYPKDTLVQGVSLNIWGENPQNGLHLGLVNGSTGDSSGLSYGLANYAESFAGVQIGWVNVSTEHFAGLQDGWVNVSEGTFKGVQLGLVNVAEEASGLQLGVVNYAKQLKGVQIGVVNMAMNNSWFDEFPDKFARGFPIFNWSF